LDQIPYRKEPVDLPKLPKVRPKPKGIDASLPAVHVVPNRYS
jgi:polyphosphate kinase